VAISPAGMAPGHTFSSDWACHLVTTVLSGEAVSSWKITVVPIIIPKKWVASLALDVGHIA